MDKHPTLHLVVAAIEKGAFESPLTMVANFTYLLLSHSSMSFFLQDTTIQINIKEKHNWNIYVSMNWYFFFWINSTGQKNQQQSVKEWTLFYYKHKFLMKLQWLINT